MSAKPTPKERKAATAKLREKHQPVFDALHIPEALFIPKMAHYVKGLEGLQMGFFENELQDDDVYTEMVSMNLESEDEKRRLFKISHNPYYEKEYAKSEPTASGDCRYFVAVEEMDEVEMPKAISTKVETEEQFEIPFDPNGDAPFSAMTLKDYAALQLRYPVSDKPWLNEIIQSKIDHGK